MEITDKLMKLWLWRSASCACKEKWETYGTFFWTAGSFGLQERLQLRERYEKKGIMPGIRVLCGHTGSLRKQQLRFSVTRTEDGQLPNLMWEHRGREKHWKRNPDCDSRYLSIDAVGFNGLKINLHRNNNRRFYLFVVSAGQWLARYDCIHCWLNKLSFQKDKSNLFRIMTRSRVFPSAA